MTYGGDKRNRQMKIDVLSIQSPISDVNARSSIGANESRVLQFE